MDRSPRRRDYDPRRTTALKTLAILAPLFLILPYWATKMHFSLPTPVVELYSPVTGRPQISELSILSHAKHLSEDIGYRTVGTREHALGDQWVLDQVEQLKDQCQKAVAQDRTRQLQCEVWRQEGSGTHRFDMMGKRVMKRYEKLSNIILRISNGTPAGKQHALLINSHIDSTVSSPGAADDGIAVGIMLEVARVLINTPDWEPGSALILLFNNAEECLQDGSHLFATQSPLASTVRAVVNLEAAGVSGPEMLFQATSEEMLEAYSHVPWPYGFVLASDVFKTGIILSDTDFRQFEEYNNLTGLDMAVVGDSYFYHTRKDTVEHIQPGVAQHFGDNVFALATYLTAPHVRTLPNLATHQTPPTSTYYSVLGKSFFMYSAQTAWTIQAAVLLSSVVVIGVTDGLRPDLITQRSAMGVIGSVLGAILGANIAAFIISGIIGRGMSWFSNEFSCVALYGPPALAGALVPQYWISSHSSRSSPRLESATFNIVHLFFTFGAILLQAAGLGSACIFSLFSIGSLFAIIINAISNSLENRNRSMHEIGVKAYFIALLLPLVEGTELSVALFAIFVPLTGRMGAAAPVDHIIATLTSIVGFLTMAFSIPLAHRISRRMLGTVIFVLLCSSVLIIFLFAFIRSPFDPLHQKRFFVLHVENVTSNEHHIHMASADGAPGFENMVNDVAAAFGTPLQPPSSVVMDDYNADWDVLYPFSQFLTPYKLQLPLPHDYSSQWVSNYYLTTQNDVVDLHSYTRTLTLVVNHPGLIWTVIAFDAHVLSWSLDSNPPPHKTRHYIKEASFYGVNSYSVDMTIVVPFDNPEEELMVNYMGIIEKASWPGKKGSQGPLGQTPVMDLFESLDGYMHRKMGDTVDLTMLGCVAGVVTL